MTDSDECYGLGHWSLKRPYTAPNLLIHTNCTKSLRRGHGPDAEKLSFSREEQTPIRCVEISYLTWVRPAAQNAQSQIELIPESRFKQTSQPPLGAEKSHSPTCLPRQRFRGPWWGLWTLGSKRSGFLPPGFSRRTWVSCPPAPALAQNCGSILLNSTSDLWENIRRRQS